MTVPSVFFFSSRRRHTRLQGDWSSDVCSSDLLALPYSRFHRVSIYAVNNSSERVTLLHQPTSLSYLQKVRGSATDQRYRVKERPALTVTVRPRPPFPVPAPFRFASHHDGPAIVTYRAQ